MTPPLPPILIDLREGAPFSFAGLVDPASVRTARLLTGDYSLEGHTEA